MSITDSDTCFSNLNNSTTCLANGGGCVVRNSTYSTCSCPNGRIGVNCDSLKVPLEGVYIFDGIFYFLVLFFWIFLAVRRYRQTKGADFEAARLKGVLTSHPSIFGSKTLLLYRFLVFGFVFGVHISAIIGSAPGTYRFYTVWNFVTVIIYFALGLALSLVMIIKGPEGITQSSYWSSNAALHYLLLEIELPNTLIVDVVVWTILLPSCGTPCPSLVNFGSFIQHLINFPLMLGDFLLSRHAFDRHHFYFNLALPTSYAIFHLFFTIANDRYGHQPVYFFMDASSPYQPAWIIGVLIIHVAIFFLVWAISTFCLRRSLNQVFDGVKADKKPLMMDVENPAYRDSASNESVKADAAAVAQTTTAPQEESTTKKDAVDV